MDERSNLAGVVVLTQTVGMATKSRLVSSEADCCFTVIICEFLVVIILIL